LIGGNGREGREGFFLNLSYLVQYLGGEGREWNEAKFLFIQSLLSFNIGG